MTSCALKYILSYYTLPVKAVPIRIIMAVRATSCEPALLSYKAHPELKKFFLDDHVQKTGNRLGSGGFGVVEEITVGGTLCAGKILYTALLAPYSDRTVDQYLSACKLMSRICHSNNIVPFVGLCLLDDSANPALVMERLDFNLENILETYNNLPFLMTLKILRDIIKGLIYLHGQTPPIVHHDLTARNVLVDKTSMCAKIADLSNALMIDPMELLKSAPKLLPRKISHLPPEAFSCNTNYDSMFDMFSFGHLALYAVTQEFPGDLLPPKMRSEVERRKQNIELLLAKLTKDHVMTVVILQCLYTQFARKKVFV